jgi:hypothetical protein
MWLSIFSKPVLPREAVENPGHPPRLVSHVCHSPWMCQSVAAVIGIRAIRGAEQRMIVGNIHTSVAGGSQRRAYEEVGRAQGVIPALAIKNVC